MWPAFPSPEYYGGSAPPGCCWWASTPTRRTRGTDAGREAPEWFPCSHDTDRRGRHPALPRWPRRVRHSPFPTGYCPPRMGRAADASERSLPRAPLTVQSARLQTAPLNEASNTGSLRMPAHLAHHTPCHLAVLTRRGFVRAACHRNPLDPHGNRLPSALSNRCDGQKSEVSHLQSVITRLTAHIGAMVHQVSPGLSRQLRFAVGVVDEEWCSEQG